MSKKDLIHFMHCMGFDWICDVCVFQGIECVASKINDGDEVWWRPIEVEGSGFYSMFKGSIRSLDISK